MAKDDEVQRALGRIESSIERLISDFGDHRNDDQRNFSSLRNDIKAEVDARTKSVGNLKEDNDRARGAGWAILAILGVLASIVGGCLVALFAGWIKIKTGTS